MDKKLKQALNLGFEAPRPKKQKEFVSSLNAPKSIYRDFFFSQISYIRKRVWVFSLAVALAIVALVLWGGKANILDDGYSLAWLTAALIPFLALLTVTELSRSASFSMEELELSCRYSLPHIVMARATILGMSNLILLLVLALSLGVGTDAPILSVGIYILVPYLLTCGASIFALNRTSGNEGIYCCAVIAFAVSLGDSILRVSKQSIYAEQYLWFWLALGLFSLLFLAIQIKKFIRTTEEFKWSLLLTA